MRKKTIVIFGVSSFVGSSLAEIFKEDYRVIGTYYRNPVKLGGVLTMTCDVLNRDSIQMILYTFKPEFTIYCAGLSSIEDCSASNNFADALNSSGLINVAQYTERYKSRLCYLSSGFIFSGSDVLNIESDTPVPNTFYGKTKASAEFYIQKTCLNYLIFRCCNFYGRGVSVYHQTFFEKLECKLEANQSIGLDNKINVGFLDIFYLAQVIRTSFDAGISNRLFQVSSRDVCSYYDFGLKYAKTFELSAGLIKRTSWDMPQIDVRVLDYNDSDKLYYKLSIDNIESTLGITLPTIDESIAKSYERLGGRTHGGAGSSGKNSDITFI